MRPVVAAAAGVPAAGSVRARRRRRTRGDEDARRGDIREKRRVLRGGGVCVRVLGIWTSRTGDGAQGRDGGVEGGRLRDGGRGGDDARAGDGGVRRRRIERNARGEEIGIRRRERFVDELEHAAVASAGLPTVGGVRGRGERRGVRSDSGSSDSVRGLPRRAHSGGEEFTVHAVVRRRGRKLARNIRGRGVGPVHARGRGRFGGRRRGADGGVSAHARRVRRRLGAKERYVCVVHGARELVSDVHR